MGRTISSVPIVGRMFGLGAHRSVRYALILVIVVSFVEVNLYFAWTSHVLSAFQPIRADIERFADYQSTLFGLTQLLGMPLPKGGTETRIVIDYTVVLFVAVAALSAFFLSVRRSFASGMVRMLQVGSLVVMPLGIEIYIFDRREFWIHASIAQVKTGFIPWFSNADVLFASIGVFFSATVLGWTLAYRRDGVLPTRVISRLVRRLRRDSQRW